jgi:hypothetical protein
MLFDGFEPQKTEDFSVLKGDNSYNGALLKYEKSLDKYNLKESDLERIKGCSLGVYRLTNDTVTIKKYVIYDVTRELVEYRGVVNSKKEIILFEMKRNDFRWFKKEKAQKINRKLFFKEFELND